MAYPTNAANQRKLRSQFANYTPAERERFVQQYLPDPIRKRGGRSSRAAAAIRQKPRPIRTFLKSSFHFLVYFAIHIFFSVYIRFRQAYHAVVDRVLAILYYHHRTPELVQKDVRGLTKLPEHLSVVLTLRKNDDALDIIVDEVAELVAWCSCAGIPMLSVYEKTGVLKSFIPTLHKIVTAKLSTYYGLPAHQPTLRIFAPHHALYSPTLVREATKTNTSSVTLLLLSATDGRETLVDLTKTLAEMAQHGKLSPQDISPALIDAELREITSPPTPPPAQAAGEEGEGRTLDPTLPQARTADESRNSSSFSTTPATGGAIDPAVTKFEPDLLLVFGPYVKLDGYPPWQIRLTEIYCTGDKGSIITGGGEAVEYQKFLKGLWRYGRAEMRFGR